MTATPDPRRTAEMIEQLLTDGELRATIRRATRVQRLETRESRSGLAGVLMTAAMEGAGQLGAGQLDHLHAPSTQTGRVPVMPTPAEVRANDLRYPGDEAPRRQIAAWMASRAERHGLPRELPVMAALVESNLANLPDGDAESVGFFQMQTVYWLARYPGYPQRPEIQMQWFIDRALEVRSARPDLARDPALWGEWIADIEQPATALRGKYGERLEAARALLAGAPEAPATAVTGAQVAPPPAPAALTGAHGVVSATEARGAGHNGVIDALKAEAERIDQAHVGYEWGGGHAGKQPYGSPVTPLDCSGAVSRVLGIEPRDSGALMSWGAPGRGERVTVYANAEHVLMEIEGHFWGTSGANPGGGPGWIPRGHVSEAYLASFTARHPPGL